LSGRSRNDALGAAGRAHRELFRRLGYEHVEIDFSKPDAQPLLDRTASEQAVEFAYSPVGMAANMQGAMPDGSRVNYWEANRIPFISLSGDSPAYYFDRHVMPTDWHACFYYFPEHLDLRRRLPRLRGLCGLVPPVPFDLAEEREIDFRRKENGKLLFLKNGNDPEQLLETWRNALPEPTFLMLADCASELSNDPSAELGNDIDKLVTEHFAHKGWDLERLTNLRIFFVAQLDDYLRRIKSALVADAIADFPVEIHGYNWDHFDFSKRRATFVPGGDYTDSRQRIIDSLGMVDMSPNTQGAPHDRAMRAFGLWSLCITNKQQFFESHFPDHEAFTYRFQKDSLQAKIADILSNPKRYIELGREVAKRFRQNRHPEDFVRFMVDTASHIRAACGPRPPGLQEFFGWPTTV
jgi:hypothetical protein